MGKLLDKRYDTWVDEGRAGGGGNVQVGTDKQAIWADSAAANTEVDVDFDQPDTIRPYYRVQVYNPSSVTGLTVKVKNVVSLGGSTRYLELASIAVDAGAALEKVVQGMFGGTDGVRLSLSNDTVLGASDGFSADIAIREA